jgi:hypothetical protein
VEILWPALGIRAIVCVAFCALAARWQRILRPQSRTVRALSERVRGREEINDPQFPRPAGRVRADAARTAMTFSFRLSDRFWRRTLGLTEQDWEFVHRHANFVGSVKVERWRSHVVTTVTEVLPTSQSAQWRKRSLDFYPEEGGREALPLWELELRSADGAAERPLPIELLLRKSAIELCAKLRETDARESEDLGPGQGVAFFSALGLDSTQR